MTVPVNFTAKILDLPRDERPREKMAAYGAAALTDAELIAILLGTGTAMRSALDIARSMTEEGGLYRRLSAMTKLEELTYIKGLGKAKAAKVLAALEIGRRLATERALEKFQFTNPRSAADFLMPRLRHAVQELFVVVLLNVKNKVIGTETISKGGISGSIVHPREVFRMAIVQNAAAIVVAHNHPSGDPLPSKEDMEVTTMLQEAGQQLHIPLLDHIIIGDGAYYSFQEQGAL